MEEEQSGGSQPAFWGILTSQGGECIYIFKCNYKYLKSNVSFINICLLEKSEREDFTLEQIENCCSLSLTHSSSLL